MKFYGKIGMMFQVHTLFPHLTAIANVIWRRAAIPDGLHTRPG